MVAEARGVGGETEITWFVRVVAGADHLILGDTAGHISAGESEHGRAHGNQPSGVDLIDYFFTIDPSADGWL